MSIFLVLLLTLLFIIGTTGAMIWATLKEEQEQNEVER
jgi:hypothetical protein